MQLKEKLEWGRLATFVPNKKTPVYNWFYYKEGFSRELVFKLAEMSGLKPGQWVMDPFCGSGTTLLACRELGINSMGFDVLPISVFASRVKVADCRTEELKELIGWLFEERFRPVRMEFPPEFRRFFSKPLRDDIAFFKGRIDQLKPGLNRDFILLGFINSVMRASWVWKDGGALKVRKHPVPPFRKFFQRRLRQMVKERSKFKGAGRAGVELGDARKLKFATGFIDGVITSPPYLHIIDYTKVYRIENWFLGEPMPAIRSYIGLGDTDPLRAYLQDMGQAIKEMFRICRPGARVSLIVGDALVGDRPADIDIKLSEMGSEAGFEQGDILVLNKRPALKYRTQKVGTLRESAVLLRKPE